MKLSAWAAQEGLHYQTAWRLWKTGKLPVPSFIDFKNVAFLGAPMGIFRGDFRGEKRMRIFAAPRARAFGPALAVLALGCSSGCLATKLVTAPLNLAGAAVGVAGDTASAVVKTSGKVILGAVRATGSIADGGIAAAAKLARAGMVTFVDAANGTLVRVAWAQGMDLLGGAQVAKVQVAARAIQVIRAGKLVQHGAQPKVSLPLEAGDVVRLGAGG